MDRISKALELAKQGQAITASQGPEQPANSSKATQYTHTKTVQVSTDTLRAHRLLSGSSQEPLLDCYRVLRTRVIRRLHQHQWKTLGITSANPGEGKTLTAINLGISLALEPNYSVLLVDADLRRPSVHTFFGLQPAQGLAEWLTGEVALEQLLIHPGLERFTFLPGARASRRSSELLVGAKMGGLIQELKSRYPARVVIFNLPPVLVGDDVVALAPRLDALLLVIEEGKTRRADLARVADLLEDTTLLGTVLNKSTEAAHTHNHDYYY